MFAEGEVEFRLELESPDDGLHRGGESSSRLSGRLVVLEASCLSPF
jgi:hypothetical protein